MSSTTTSASSSSSDEVVLKRTTSAANPQPASSSPSTTGGPGKAQKATEATISIPQYKFDKIPGTNRFKVFGRLPDIVVKKYQPTQQNENQNRRKLTKKTKTTITQAQVQLESPSTCDSDNEEPMPKRRTSVERQQSCSVALNRPVTRAGQLAQELFQLNLKSMQDLRRVTLDRFKRQCSIPQGTSSGSDDVNTAPIVSISAVGGPGPNCDGAEPSTSGTQAGTPTELSVTGDSEGKEDRSILNYLNLYRKPELEEKKRIMLLEKMAHADVTNRLLYRTHLRERKVHGAAGPVYFERRAGQGTGGRARRRRRGTVRK